MKANSCGSVWDASFFCLFMCGYILYIACVWVAFECWLLFFSWHKAQSFRFFLFLSWLLPYMHRLKKKKKPKGNFSAKLMSGKCNDLCKWGYRKKLFNSALFEGEASRLVLLLLSLENTYRVEQKFRYGRNKSWNFLENSIVLDSLLVAAIKTGYFLWLGSVSVIPS